MEAKKLRLTVAHNGDPDLVPQLAELTSVESVFGKIPGDLVGGGRNSFALAELDIGQLKQLVAQAHAYGMQFVYLLNAPCLSNRETTRHFNNQLYAFVAGLVDMGVDAFVVSLPYLVDLIKHHFPSAKVTVSTFALVNSIKKAKAWEEKGADRILLHQDVNRDFSLMEKIRKAVSCEIELFANNLCVDQCPYPPFHATFNAHGSAAGDVNGGFGLDYCAYHCALRRLENPVEFLKGRFIRPEDLHLYESLGVNVFKLADRVKPTPWIVNVARAYHERRYDGNLVDLIGYPYLRGEGDVVLTDPARFMVRPDLVNLGVLNEIKAVGRSETIVYVDNRKLDGFADHFIKHDCRRTICGEECRHCDRFAQEAVTVDVEKAGERIAHYRRLIEMMVDRTAFADEPFFKRVSIHTMRKTASVLHLARHRGAKKRSAALAAVK